MAQLNDFDEDDLETDAEINPDIDEKDHSSHSSLEIRRKIEDLLEAKRLRMALDDFYDN